METREQAWKRYCEHHVEIAPNPMERAKWRNRGTKGEDSSFAHVAGSANGAEKAVSMKVKWEAWLANNGSVKPSPAFVPLPVAEEHEEEETSPVAHEEPSGAPHITDSITLQGKHSETALIRTVLRLGEFPFAWGNPGAGKTHLVESMAADMGLPIVIQVCAKDLFASVLLGSKSPLTGEYFSTDFRRVWEFGGVFLFDECGMTSSGFLNVLNSAMAQGAINFPDGKRVPRHEHCFLIFADNTALYGNDPRFPEREDVGGAFRDRLTYIDFPYDLKIEKSVLTRIFGSSVRALRFHSDVCAMRKWLEEQGDLPVFASPRFSYQCAKYLVAGVPVTKALSMTLFRGQTEDILCRVRPKAMEIFS